MLFQANRSTFPHQCVRSRCTMTAPYRRLLGVALLIGLTILVPATVGAQHFPADEDLQTMLRYLVEDGETPGIVLGVLEADGSTRIVSYGSAGPDARPLGPRSVFEIGSITKTFTATLLDRKSVV